MKFPQPSLEAPQNIPKKEQSLSPEEVLEDLKKYKNLEGKGNEAFVNFCFTALRPVVGRILGPIHSEEDVDDVVQNATIKAVQNLDKFNGDSSLKTWVSTIGTNSVMDFLRRVKVRKNISQKVSLEDEKEIEQIKDMDILPDEDAVNKDLIKKVFATLTPDQERLITLKYVEGMSVREISKMLGVPQTVLGQRIHSIKVKVRDFNKKHKLI